LGGNSAGPFESQCFNSPANSSGFLSIFKWEETHPDASFASKQKVRQSQNTTWRFSSNITPYIYRYVLIIWRTRQDLNLQPTD